MAVFSKTDDAEIKRRREELDRLKVDLELTDKDLLHQTELLKEQQRAFEAEREAFRKEVKERRDRSSARDADLLSLEAALAEREHVAQAGFIVEQRTTLQAALRQHDEAMSARAQELSSREEKLAAALGSLAQREAELAAQELDVQEKALKVDAGVAKKGEALSRDLSARAKRLDAQEKELDARHEGLLGTQAALERRTAELLQGEEELARAVTERDSGFAGTRRGLDQELRELRRSVEAELEQHRTTELAAIEKDLVAEKRKQEGALKKSIEAQQKKAAVEQEKIRTAFETGLLQDRERLDAEAARLQALQAELETKKRDVDLEKTRCEAILRSVESRTQALDEEVAEHIAEERASFDAREEALSQECARLRERILRSEKTLGLYEELKEELGGEHPEKILLLLDQKEKELLRLHEELRVNPGVELRRERDLLIKERDEARGQLAENEEEVLELLKRVGQSDQLHLRVQGLKDENTALSSQAENLRAECERVTAELKRFQSVYEAASDTEKRIEQIREPYLLETPKIAPQGITPEDEIAWLQRIDASCLEYGLRFPRRILWSFHTALKTAEWSPLTVLAGVSGTGKSELPRLYAHFGGLSFLGLPVQPNWDSQESMLGFFNSIDNKFDAQPMLRLLAQSQEKASHDYPHGLKDSVCLILLDEMNLAHPELYFSEFLSKLESRRGCRRKDIPHLDVKLGAGIPPYRLPMGRNVLWAGTMNEDETTKSLSDKVLDRSIVIHFPRPTCLERRKELKPLPAVEALLARKTWESWWLKSSDFSPEEVAPFKTLVEDINGALAKVGRALGHRVWQSVEYYMANYPDVRLARGADDRAGLERAMRVAFEDQLVQKIMPKLRGIETRGRSREACLNPIRGLLDENRYDILDDFDLSCEFGYGQFIWQTANYLQQEPEPGVPEGTSETAAVDGAEAPSEGKSKSKTKGGKK